MNSGKIVGLVVAALVVGMMVYVLSSGSSKPTTEVKQEVAQKQEVKKLEEKSEEQAKLDELKKEATATKEVSTSKLYAQRCAACHGYNGEGTVGPAISGKEEREILAKLDDYRNDRVQNSLMKGLLKNSSDDELQALAKEISQFK